MAAESKVTTDPKEIKKWAEERKGTPSQIKGTGSKNDSGLLRINFPGGKEDSLEEISWDDFFEKFEEKKLAFLYQEKTAGGKISRFSKIISRETAENNQKSKSKPAPKKEAAKSDTKPKAAAKAKSDGRPKTDAKAKPKTEPKAKSDAKPKAKAATSKTKAAPKAKANSKAKAKA